MRATSESIKDVLRGGNPMSISAARQIAEHANLRSAVFERIRNERHTSSPAIAVHSPALRGRRRAVATSFALAAALFVAITVTPALAFIKDALPFFSQPSASPLVKIQFDSLNRSAPTGMSPAAIADQTRAVGVMYFGGSEHTLWAAPTLGRGFCFEWSDAWGGCNRDGQAALSWSGELALPEGVKAAKLNLTGGVGGLLNASTAAIINKERALSVPVWVAGYVSASAADDVVISFSDGSTYHPHIRWISAPINAGFFAYDVPVAQRTLAAHVVDVAALTSDGKVVAEQPASQ